MRISKEYLPAFTKTTTSYNLIVRMRNNSLEITIQDYCDWTVYSKKFNKKNIGNEINQKSDLIDIYFNITSQEDYPKNIQNKKSKTFQSIQREQTMYDVLSEGNLIVYGATLDSKGNKQIKYKSNLKLQKIRQMTFSQKQISRTKIQNLKLREQLYKLKKEESKMQIYQDQLLQ